MLHQTSNFYLISLSVITCVDECMDNEGKSCTLVTFESNSVHEKIMRFRLAENKYILMYHKTKVVLRVQITNSARALFKISSVLTFGDFCHVHY